MTTAQTLINDAYIEARVVDTVDAPDANQLSVGLRFFNRIIGRLSVKNALIPYSTSENFVTVAGTSQYTMGSAGTASSSRALKILNARYRDSDNSDFPITVVSEITFNQIRDKTTQDNPSVLFYDPIYPVGIINLYPVPSDAKIVYIESQKYLDSELSLGTTVNLPREYEDALVTTLGAKLARVNGSPTYEALYRDAGSAWRALASLNMSQRVPVAVLPFSHAGGSTYDFKTAPAGVFPFVFPFVLG